MTIVNVIPMVPSQYEGDASLKSHCTLRLPNGKRFGIGCIPEGASGRKVYQGPEVAGPWAFTFGLCTVIDNHPARRAAERDADVLVQDGTALEIDGTVYTVRVVRREFIELDNEVN